MRGQGDDKSTHAHQLVAARPIAGDVALKPHQSEDLIRAIAQGER